MNSIIPFRPLDSAGDWLRLIVNKLAKLMIDMLRQV